MCLLVLFLLLCIMFQVGVNDAQPAQVRNSYWKSQTRNDTASCKGCQYFTYIATWKKLPIPVPSAHCRPIHKIDPITQNVLETYYSMSDANKKCKVGKQTLQNAINGNCVQNGYIWAYK